MTQTACWLSREEQVQVVKSPKKNRFAKYSSMEFMATREDGSLVFIDRLDILLQEEEELIKELSNILKTYHNPTRSERYSLILKQLMMQGVPFSKRLKQRMGRQTQEQILLEY